VKNLSRTFYSYAVEREINCKVNVWPVVSNYGYPFLRVGENCGLIRHPVYVGQCPLHKDYYAMTVVVVF
jgi:hypothetical protein